MTTTMSKNESRLNVAGTEVQMFSGGSGPPLVYLHGAGGTPGWQTHHEDLSQHYTVYAPAQPGFNGTERPDWISTITDVAHFNLEMIQVLGLENYILIGSSMGGWLSAEMAAMDHGNLKALVLIDAAGVRPVKGEIAEIFMVSSNTRAGQRFFDTSQVPNYESLTQEPTPEQVLVEPSNREMASRLCWKPYLHNPSLPHYLKKVTTPALVVWGKQDAIIPLECGEMYQQALPNASLKVIDQCGHSPQVEKPQEFNKVVIAFLSDLN